MNVPGKENMNDEQLVESVLLGDSQAQRRLYERFARKMFGICLRYSGRNEEAEDLLQEGFIRVFKSLAQYRKTGSLEGWVRKVIINTALEYLRSRKMVWTGLEAAEEFTEESPVLDRIGTDELIRQIQELPPGYRIIFNLYAIEGYNHQEIAEMLQISEGTSKSQYSRARRQLMAAIIKLQGNPSSTMR